MLISYNLSYFSLIIYHKKHYQKRSIGSKNFLGYQKAMENMLIYKNLDCKKY